MNRPALVVTPLDAQSRRLSLCEGPICDRDPYPRYEPGEYEVRCLKADIYLDPRFRRNVCLLRCVLVHDPKREVCCFLNLGGGGKQSGGRGSRYWRAWVIANGAQPQRRQRLSVKVFVGKIFRVRIGDVEKNMDGAEHSEMARYSIVQEIISRRWP